MAAAVFEVLISVVAIGASAVIYFKLIDQPLDRAFAGWHKKRK